MIFLNPIINGCKIKRARKDGMRNHINNLCENNPIYSINQIEAHLELERNRLGFDL